MRILITGGSGFIGKYLIKLLERTKNNVIIFNKTNIHNNIKNIKSYKVNLAKSKSYIEILNYKILLLHHGQI